MVLTEPNRYEGVVYESTDYKKDQIMKFLREYAYGGSAQKKKEVLGLMELNERTLSLGNNLSIIVRSLHCTRFRYVPPLHRQW
jgi:hypothetical protein